jgi:hypothetical protein
MHPYKKTVVHKLYNTNHGPRLNLVNWCFHGVSAGKTALTFFLFHSKAWFHLRGYMNYQNHVYQFAEFTLFHKVPSYDVKTHVSRALMKQLWDPFLFRDPKSKSIFTHILTIFFKNISNYDRTFFFQDDSGYAHSLKQFYTLFRDCCSISFKYGNTLTLTAV